MISIIIPVYNSDKYLNECLSSVKNQTYKNFEVLCIDDGSTDNSKRIIQSYCELDCRFKYFYKEHSNAGEARNVGIEYSLGEYLLFIDSDDFLNKSILEELNKVILSKNSDIIIFQYKLYNDINKRFSKYSYGIHCNRKYDFCLADMRSERFSFTNISVWNKLYRAKFIQHNNLKFKSRKVINDLFFSWSSLICAKQITLCKTVGIYYRVNTGRSISDNLLYTKDNFIDAFDEFNQYVQSNKLWDIYKKDLIKKENEQFLEFFNRLKKYKYMEEACSFEEKMNMFFSKHNTEE